MLNRPQFHTHLGTFHSTVAQRHSHTQPHKVPQGPHSPSEPHKVTSSYSQRHRLPDTHTQTNGLSSASSTHPAREGDLVLYSLLLPTTLAPTPHPSCSPGGGGAPGTPRLPPCLPPQAGSSPSDGFCSCPLPVSQGDVRLLGSGQGHRHPPRSGPAWRPRLPSPLPHNAASFAPVSAPPPHSQGQTGCGTETVGWRGLQMLSGCAGVGAGSPRGPPLEFTPPPLPLHSCL